MVKVCLKLRACLLICDGGSNNQLRFDSCGLTERFITPLDVCLIQECGVEGNGRK
jgi:hypothetical protein